MKGGSRILITLCFALLLFGCSKQEDDDSSCPYYARSQPKRSLGTALIDSGFRSWLRVYPETIRFVNSNGGAFDFFVDQRYGNRTEVELGEEHFKSECWETRMKFYIRDDDDIRFMSEGEVTFDLSLKRMVYIDSNNEEWISDTSKTKYEYLRFDIGRKSVNFYLKDSLVAFKSQYSFFDTTYSDVLVCERKDIDAGVYPTKFILQRNYGLVGFEFSNNEKWKRQ